MATKLGRKALPSGLSPDDFKYVGRPAKEQGDFEDDVGIVDMACVNQFGEANNSKYYHAGVVQGNGQWFVYLEWGRISGGKSWNGGFGGGDFQFVQCTSEGDARAFFKKQCMSKNLKRLEKKKIGGKTIYAGKNGKDGYLVQSLATRERGLPDAYSIKDDSGVKKKAKKKTTKKKATKKIDAQPQVIKLAADLVGGTADYARAAQQASGIVPTMDAITEVRDELIPTALELLKKIGNDEAKQLKNKKLQDLSKLVATIVPRPIPRGGDPTSILLSQNNIFAIQQDLDAFEAALKNEDFDEVEIKGSTVDPNQVLGRRITWIDPKSERGKWVEATYLGMTNNRHGHLRSKFKVLNMFAVEDEAKRKAFIQRAKAIAKARKGDKLQRAELQPKKRGDVSDISDIYKTANVMMGIHGTRAVNVQPILASNLRLPRQLKGVHISGSAFGAGIYFADDIKKSHGYTGASGSYWVKGGAIKRRGFFMFLCDVTIGKPHMTKTTLWGQPNVTRGYDSVFAKRNITSVANNEYVIFDPNQQFIRYIIEATT